MSIYSPSRVGRKTRPWHRSNGGWGTLCGRSDTGNIIITDRDIRVTCRVCLARMRALRRRYGPGIAR